MTPPPTPLGPIHALDALAEVDARLLELLPTLSADEWHRPTIVPRWQVRHVAAHLLDTALRKLSIVRDGHAAEGPASGHPDDIRVFVDRLNAEGVAVFGRLSRAALTSQMRVAVQELDAFHRRLDPHALAVFSVSWAGETASPNWFDLARELTERWHHQEQIRLATGRPSLMTPSLYHPVIDCFMRALPHRYRDVWAESGAHLAVDVSGPSGGTWRLVRAVDRWLLTLDPLEHPAAIITLPESIMWRLFTKSLPRAEALQHARIEGDAALAGHLLGTIAIVG